jgi:hypothetical protein
VHRLDSTTTRTTSRRRPLPLLLATRTTRPTTRTRTALTFAFSSFSSSLPPLTFCSLTLQRTTTTARRASKATPTPKKHCPDGKTLSGDLLDLCIDIDTDPLWVGGGIKIGHGPPKTTTRARSGGKPTQSSRPQKNNNHKDDHDHDHDEKKKHCPDGQTLGGALLDLCVDIDTDPLYIGAGIKIGSGPSPEKITSSRGRVPTPGPKGKKEAPHRHNNNDGDDRPECGENDPLALLDLCIKVGDLLGVRFCPSSSSSSSSSRTDSPLPLSSGKR